MNDDKVRNNLHFDWHGLLAWWGVESEEGKREIINDIVYEIMRWQNRPLWQKLFRIKPKVSWFKKEQNEKKNSIYN